LPKEIEGELVRHIEELDSLFFGIHITDLRKLAFQIANAYGFHGFSINKEMASKTRYYGFM